MVFLKDFFEKVDFEKNQQMTKKVCTISQFKATPKFAAVDMMKNIIIVCFGFFFTKYDLIF